VDRGGVAGEPTRRRYRLARRPLGHSIGLRAINMLKILIITIYVGVMLQCLWGTLKVPGGT
jgi:hypothetical protein